jgi:hypothetical protein
MPNRCLDVPSSNPAPTKQQTCAPAKTTAQGVSPPRLNHHLPRHRGRRSCNARAHKRGALEQPAALSVPLALLRSQMVRVRVDLDRLRSPAPREQGERDAGTSVVAAARRGGRRTTATRPCRRPRAQQAVVTTATLLATQRPEPVRSNSVILDLFATFYFFFARPLLRARSRAAQSSESVAVALAASGALAERATASEHKSRDDLAFLAW